MEINDKVKNLLSQLESKYESMGQDMTSYLEGLLYAGSTKYWEYIQTDTLLSLQKPKTNIPDEMIFIMYHQITELYFKLSLHETDQIAENKEITAEWMTARLKRINNYFINLTNSFGIMREGMEYDQFLKFRMSLLPASGFQSAQYRLIEISSTPLVNIVAKDVREQLKSTDDSETLVNNLYWKAGATELETKKKTLTLTEFEEKYTATFIEYAEKRKHNNIWKKFESIENKTPELIAEIKRMDLLINVEWPMVHMRTAGRYLQANGEDTAATGGTNWRQYLAPRIQKRIFFPELWTANEQEQWGSFGVEELDSIYEI